MANVKLYLVTNPLLNVNFSLHLPRNRNLSVVTAAALRAGVSFFREWQRIEQLRTCAKSYADSKLLLATYLIDVSQTVKKKKKKKKKIYIYIYIYKLQLKFTGKFCSQHTWSMYRRLWAVSLFSLQGYCTLNPSAGWDNWRIVRKKEDFKQSRCIRLGVLILHEV